MGDKLTCMVRMIGHSLAEWLNRQSFKVILILSFLHIALSYIHTRHSGRADYASNCFSSVFYATISTGCSVIRPSFTNFRTSGNIVLILLSSSTAMITMA